MIRRVMIACLLARLLLPTLALAQGAAGDLLGRINALRASLGLPGYSLNGQLSAAAQQQAQWMADTAQVSHVHPDGSGPRTRAVNAGYPSTDVSENIYAGTNATVDTAWAFWINSPVHYRGLTNERYRDVGIGIASSSWGTAYVLVFGNPGGPQPYVAPMIDASGQNNNPSGPPSYVKGLDPHGFIMHEIQPEDTLGDIALLYGYTWGDIPYMKEVNGIIDNRLLKPGEIFLVPPHDGTYTPTPGGEEPPSATPEGQDAAQASATPSPTDAPTELPSDTPVAIFGIATSAAMPEVLALAVNPTPSATPLVVAEASTQTAPALAASSIVRSGPSPWLMIGLVMQVGLLLIAGIELARRARRGRRS